MRGRVSLPHHKTQPLSTSIAEPNYPPSTPSPDSETNPPPLEHLPAIEATPHLTLKAVYSRSQSSAEALAAASKNPGSVAVYFDSPATPGKSLSDLLQRADIAAVDVALPILQQPAVVEQALRAGKHVLSEKPVAGDVEGAKRLIAVYEGLAGGGEGKPLWGVAENWRYLASLRYAAEKLREVGGEVLTFRLAKYGSVKGDNKYFNTACKCCAVLFWVWLGSWC